MKKLSIALLAVVLVITASFKASAQTEQTKQVSDFNTISAAGPFNIHVKMDGTESLKLSAPAEIINDIEVVVEKNKLNIGFKENSVWNYNGKVDVYITAKALSSLSVTGSGEMTVEGTLSSADLNFVISGSGHITTTVKSNNLTATITGSGTMNVDGSTESAHLVVTGSGRYNAKELKTNTANVTLTGSGNAHITADKALSATITGAGQLVYSGNASVTDIRTAGTGRVSKENE